MTPGYPPCASPPLPPETHRCVCTCHILTSILSSAHAVGFFNLQVGMITVTMYVTEAGLTANTALSHTLKTGPIVRGVCDRSAGPSMWC